MPLGAHAVRESEPVEHQPGLLDAAIGLHHDPDYQRPMRIALHLEPEQRLVGRFSDQGADLLGRQRSTDASGRSR